MNARWEVTIDKGGLWPARWRWVVWRKDGIHYDLRQGSAITKDRAHRKAAEAKVSMQQDDIRIIDE